jgi:hypothetical protein
MPTMLRSGPVLLALAVALAGCSRPVNPPQTSAAPSAKKASSAVAGPDLLPGSSQVVLTVEGMT